DYSNLHKWIEELDKTLEAKLARRLEEAIHVWTLVLQQNRDELEDEREANILPKINTITLEIRIVSQFITVVPSLEKAKSDLFDQFYHWHSIITAQPRISSSQFSTYKCVLLKLPKKQQRLFEAYKAIDDVLLKTNDYVNAYCTGQKFLNNHRFKFPLSWLYAENVEGEWSALMDVLERKNTSIQTQITNLQTRILEEDKLLEKHISDLINEWNKSRPVKGAIRPKDALAILTNFEDKFNPLKKELENILKAKNALEISEPVVSLNQQSTSKLELALEDLYFVFS
uniref:Uncharacterized protein n=1 Tax=Meloidogyne javanica TaxID=6303 RepID=A0A915LY92_MELJA